MAEMVNLMSRTVTLRRYLVETCIKDLSKTVGYIDWIMDKIKIH